jgi:SAM-dependent methyltransferase
MEREHFWFAGRRDLIDSLLTRHLSTPHATIADIGSGGGYYCQMLAARGYRMTAVDFLADGLRRLSQHTPTIHTVQSAAGPLALRDNSFQCALALDVLEHLDDDAAAAADLYRILKPNGILLATVPAFDWLWSYRDEAAGHRRRYRREPFQQLLRNAGFTIERTGYYNFFLLPLAAASRLAGRVVTTKARDLEDLPPAWLNGLFRSINRAEVRWNRSLNWPCGSSLFAVARKL